MKIPITTTRYGKTAYDKNMHLWKAALLAHRIVNEPSSRAVRAAFTSTAWNLENRHLTDTTTQSKTAAMYLLWHYSQYSNFIAYSTPSGLAQIVN